MKNIFLAVVALIFSATVANAEVVGQFTSGVKDRQPIDTIDIAGKDNIENIFLFTEIKGHNGQVITHIWKNGDKEISRQNFNVGGDRWRVWSSVVVDHFENADVANVEVQDEQGNLLHVSKIEVIGETKDIVASEEEAVVEEDKTEEDANQ